MGNMIDSAAMAQFYQPDFCWHCRQAEFANLQAEFIQANTLWSMVTEMLQMSENICYVVGIILV